MSFEIPEWFVQQYSRNVMMQVQQGGSRLRGTVSIENVVGKSAFVDRMGPTAAILRLTRHGDSPLVSTPHSRRRLDLVDWEWGDLVDKADKVRLLNDPTSPYAVNAAWAMGREMDRAVITAFDADALAGAGGAGDTTTAVSFPGTQSIAATFAFSGSASSGLILDKILEAKRILDENEVPDGDRFFATSAQSLQDLLTITEVTSSDFNSIKALVSGQMNTFLGFTWLRTELLPLDGGDIRSCFAWSRPGIKLGIGMDINAEIAVRADKSFSTYVYYSMSIGATRTEEERVVRIFCDESP